MNKIKRGIEEEEKKVGRPTKGKLLSRERTNSRPIIEIFKRGKKRKEEKAKMVGLEAFKKSTRMERSSVRREKGGWQNGRHGKKMRAGFKEIIKEMKELREDREEIKRGWRKVEDLEKKE